MNLQKILLVLSVILIPLFLILLSYQLVFNFSPYSPNQQDTINFLKNKQELNTNITQEEISHLNDVKEVMDKTNYFFYFLLVFLVLFFIYNYKDKKELKKILFYGGIVGISFILLLVSFSLISFNSLFAIFHQVFFPQGNWMFNINSFLIQTFPLIFFISFLSKVVILSLSLALAFILISFSVKTKK